MIDRARSAAATAAVTLLFAAGCSSEAPTLEGDRRGSASATSGAVASGSTQDATPAASRSRSGDPAASSPAPVAAGAVRVTTVTVQPRVLTDEVVLTGELRANEAVSLRSRTDGHVVALHFREGQAIRQGDLLLEIADTTLQAERRQVAVQRDFAVKRADRSKALLDEETISRDLYEEAASRADELEASLAVIDARIALTEVRAPFDGTIGLRAVSVGSYLTPAVEIATLHAVDPIKLDLSAPERYAQRIHTGDRVQFNVTGIDKTFEGTVYAIEPRIDSETRTMRVRARAPNPRARLLPGAFASARLTLGSADDALLIPSIALVPGLDATTVFVVEDGLAQPRAVTTGVRTQTQVEIVDGLAAGDEVIVSGVLQLQAGATVDVARKDTTEGQGGAATGAAP